MSEPFIVDQHGDRILTANAGYLQPPSEPAVRKKQPAMVAADDVLVDALGSVIAEMRAEWQRDLELIRNEARATIAEFKTMMLEALLAQHAPDAVERLRAIDGGRR